MKNIGFHSLQDFIDNSLEIINNNLDFHFPLSGTEEKKYNTRTWQRYWSLRNGHVRSLLSGHSWNLNILMLKKKFPLSANVKSEIKSH